MPYTRVKLAALAALYAALFATAPAHAGTFTADFTGPKLDPKLTAATSGMKGTPAVSTSNGSAVISYAPVSQSYDFGVARLVTTFTVLGNFVAHVTVQTAGTVEAGLEVFSGIVPAQLNPSGSSTSFPNEFNGYGNSNQTIGYQRPSGYGYSLLSYTVLDLEIRRTGTLVERLYDRHDGRGYVNDPNSSSSAASLSGPVSLALFLTNVSGNAAATFRNFTISGSSVADSTPMTVPEPASFALLSFGMLMAASLRRRWRL